MSAKLARHLNTISEVEVSFGDIEALGIMRNKIAQTISTAEVELAIRARGWRMTTLKEPGRPGKGKLLVRAS